MNGIMHQFSLLAGLCKLCFLDADVIKLKFDQVQDIT